MNVVGQLHQGMRLVGPDGRELGTVERFDADHVYAGGRRIPVAAFERADRDRLYVGQTGLEYLADRSPGIKEPIRVPLVEERLGVGTQQVERGTVEIRKGVEVEQVSIPVELTRDAVRVEQVDVPDRAVAAGAPDLFQEGTIRVPVHGQEAVVSKEAVVTGEVVIERERVIDQQVVSDTLRRESASVDHDDGVPVHHRDGGVPHSGTVSAHHRAG